jgi:hypothetical protein
MPSVQRGSVVKRGKRNYGARYYDDEGRRRYRGGFETESAAWAWLRDRVDEVEAIRRGDVATIRRRRMPTLAELVEEFVEQHSAEDSTIAALRSHFRLSS